MLNNKVRLGDLIEVLTDYHANGAYKKLKENVELLDDEDYALMVRTTNFENNDFHDSVKYISEHAYNFLEKSKVYPNDLIMNKIANAGSIYLMPDLQRPVSLAMNLFLIRVNEKLANPIYVYLYLKINEQYVKQFANGSVTKTITKEAVRNLEIFLPSREEQDIVVEQYLSLDNKINLNLKINQNLESITQAIFKSWFIDFDVVRAKIQAKQEGKDSELAAMCVISGKSEEELQQMPEEDFAELQATAALFPDELVESELGDVPKGWTLTLLKDVTTELRRGISPKYTEEPNGAIVINQKCIRNHTINFSLARKHDSSKRKIDGRELQIGDVLVNSTGVGTLGRIASVRYLDSITVVDSHVTVVRANDKKVSRAYLQGLLLENEKFIEASGAGTTGQTELRKEVLQEIKFPNPAVALHQQFDSIIYKINQEIANLEKMNISLSHVRDTLLPKLLSGELDVSCVQDEVA